MASAHGPGGTASRIRRAPASIESRDMTEPVDIRSAATTCAGLQDRICAALESADGAARFVEDAWTPRRRRRRAHAHPARRRGVRAGRRRLLRRVRRDAAAVGDRARGRSWPARRGARSACRWCSIRAIRTCRPRTPTCATSARTRDGETVAWWFGGGFDLTPFYPFDEDVLHWHRTARDAVRAVRRRSALRRAQALVRRVLLPQASRRDARRRRPVLRRPARATSSATSPTCARSATASSTPTCRSSSAAATRPTASANASSSCTGADATSSSTWSATAARCSACSRGGRTESILMSLPPRCAGNTATRRNRAAPKRGWPTTCSRATGSPNWA